MRCFRLVLAPLTFLLLTLTLFGCDRSSDPRGNPWHQTVLAVYPTNGNATLGKPDDPAALRGDGSSRLRGTVRLLGKRPNIQSLNDRLMTIIRNHPRSEDLLKAPEEELTQPYWRLALDGGVADVVVWLKAPADRYLTIPEGPPTWPSLVPLRVGQAAFVPHVRIAFPEYRDPENGARQVRTEQKVVLRNTSPGQHSVSWSDGGPNARATHDLPPGGVFQLPNLKPSSDPVRLTTALPWMTAHIWVFEHPYTAVSTAEGHYQIDNVPIGVPVRIIAWHEAAGYLAGGKEGTEVRLGPGENTFNFEIRLP
jgi:hypothetical protein